MRPNYFFYDLETSGLNPREDRIMQFAGIRTDLDFQPIGDPVNLLVQLTNDTLPSPGAIMVTGITPQTCQQDGISERDFCKFIVEEMAAPNTIIMGYNSIRFDDEFMRSILWRNFYDPYAWQWQDGRSRWDLLDVIRLTRALRPEGIEWPFSEDGRATNRLELITKLNGISHEHAHDALSDVEALIAVTKLVHDKQPQLFDYLFKLKDKRQVKKLVNLEDPRPFVYASGRYPAEFEKTTVAYPIAMADNERVLVYDLRYNLEDVLKIEGENQALSKNKSKKTEHRKLDVNKPFYRENFFPIVKPLAYNRCPAVAPISVLEKANGWEKIGLTKPQVEANLASLKAHPEFVERVTAYAGKHPAEYGKPVDAESAIYSGFVKDNTDKNNCAAVRAAEAADLRKFQPTFNDQRLPELFLHYKAKFFPTVLDEDEAQEWEKYRTKRLDRQATKFIDEMGRIEVALGKGETFGGHSADDCKYLLEELSLWYQSLLPEDW